MEHVARRHESGRQHGGQGQQETPVPEQHGPGPTWAEAGLAGGGIAGSSNSAAGNIARTSKAAAPTDLAPSDQDRQGNGGRRQEGLAERMSQHDDAEGLARSRSKWRAVAVCAV